MKKQRATGPGFSLLGVLSSEDTVGPAPTLYHLKLPVKVNLEHLQLKK